MCVRVWYYEGLFIIADARLVCMGACVRNARGRSMRVRVCLCVCCVLVLCAGYWGKLLAKLARFIMDRLCLCRHIIQRHICLYVIEFLARQRNDARRLRRQRQRGRDARAHPFCKKCTPSAQFDMWPYIQSAARGGDGFNFGFDPMD